MKLDMFGAVALYRPDVWVSEYVRDFSIRAILACFCNSDWCKSTLWVLRDTTCWFCVEYNFWVYGVPGSDYEQSVLADEEYRSDEGGDGNGG